MTKISFIRGDITQQMTTAIVNAANSSLLGGGGVDGAIHLAAGPGLLAACRQLGGCKTGDAKITAGFRLPAKYVIHTVGPVWYGGNDNGHSLLARCYENSLQLAKQHSITTISFPNISTGVYNFPKAAACRIAWATVSEFCKNHPQAFTEILFVCHDQENYALYQAHSNAHR